MMAILKHEFAPFAVMILGIIILGAHAKIEQRKMLEQMTEEMRKL